MTQRIYLTIHGESSRLIRASTPSAARNHVAKNSIIVSVASQDDIVRMIQDGRVVEETAADVVQKELGE
jgi:hypothetical protein